ncbi:hypothetical protein M9458_035001, partial [Cirrhinus mrigala]
SSQTLTHGPTTPAKTPSTSRSVRTQDSSDRRGNKSTPVQGPRSASRVQLFSPSPEQETPFNSSQCLSGVSAFSSPSFSSVWSPAPRNTPSERRSAQRASLGDFMMSPPETQPSPSAQQHRGRRRSGGREHVVLRLRMEVAGMEVGGRAEVWGELNQCHLQH